jgi:hypothetical protein
MLSVQRKGNAPLLTHWRYGTTPLTPLLPLAQAVRAPRRRASSSSSSPLAPSRWAASRCCPSPSPSARRSA